jgi:sulfatase modifying factor 1
VPQRILLAAEALGCIPRPLPRPAHQLHRPHRQLLPTEAEWEFAARGGLEQKRLPWGDEPYNSRENYALRWLEGPEPVGTSAPNDCRLYDVCENVHEWCSDWYDARHYDYSPSDIPCVPESGTAARRGVGRGGNRSRSRGARRGAASRPRSATRTMGSGWRRTYRQIRLTEL